MHLESGMQLEADILLRSDDFPLDASNRLPNSRTVMVPQYLSFPDRACERIAGLQLSLERIKYSVSLSLFSVPQGGNLPSVSFQDLRAQTEHCNGRLLGQLHRNGQHLFDERGETDGRNGSQRFLRKEGGGEAADEQDDGGLDVDLVSPAAGS